MVMVFRGMHVAEKEARSRVGVMFARRLGVALAVLALTLPLAGCAGSGADSEEQPSDWLRQGPRTIGLVAGTGHYPPQLWTLESTEDRANRAGADAVAGVFSTVAGDPMAMFGALIYSPGIYLIGAAWGGIVADFRVIGARALSTHPDAMTMFSDAADGFMIDRTIWEHIARIAKGRRHPFTIVPIESKQDAERALKSAEIDGFVEIRVSGVGLAYEEDDEPNLRLRIETDLYLRRGGSHRLVKTFAYLSHGQDLDEWAGNGGKPLREELDHASQDIAQQIDGYFLIAQPSTPSTR